MMDISVAVVAGSTVPFAGTVIEVAVVFFDKGCSTEVTFVTSVEISALVVVDV